MASLISTPTVLIPIAGKHGVGKFLQIDEADVPLLRGKTVRLNSSRYPQILVYAGKKPNGNPKYTKYLVHRLVLGLTKQDKVEVDHKDQNKLNATKDNLRIASRSANCHNKAKMTGCSSQYIGVCWCNKKWVAHIRLGTRPTHLGCFTSEVAAAQAYDAAALAHYGEFAKTNF